MPGHGLDSLAGVERLQVILQLLDILRKVVRGRHRVAPQRPRRRLVRARRAAQAEIDAIRIERRQRPELLRDDQRRVIRQHHPARADADRLRPAGDIADDHRGRRAGDAGHVVMLGQPIPPIAPTFRMLREIERTAQGIPRRRTLRNG